MNSIGKRYLQTTKMNKNNQDFIDVVDFISSEASINKMMVFSDVGLPALTGIVQELEDKFANCPGFPLNHNAPNHNAPNRRTVGWIIKFVMRQVGYVPVEGGLSERARLRDFSGNKYFATSAIYSKRLEPQYILTKGVLLKKNNPPRNIKNYSSRNLGSSQKSGQKFTI